MLREDFYVTYNINICNTCENVRFPHLCIQDPEVNTKGGVKELKVSTEVQVEFFHSFIFLLLSDLL